MKKIAFFVEGQTEQVFVHWLVKKLLGKHNISVIKKRFVGGRNVPKQVFVRSVDIVRNPEYQVLINDCGADNRVKSEILDNIESLSESGYSHIVGLRDLYPLPLDDLYRLEKGLKFLPKRFHKLGNPYSIIIAVHEVETWFLAETHHFKKVDRRLTGKFIHDRLGFNPDITPAIDRKHPSRDLNNIYQLVGKSYTKRYTQVQKLVNRLDFDHLNRHVKHDIASLHQLINIIEDFRKSK